MRALDAEDLAHGAVSDGHPITEPRRPVDDGHGGGGFGTRKRQAEPACRWPPDPAALATGLRPAHDSGVKTGSTPRRVGPGAKGLAEALARLPAAQWTALELRYLQG